MTVAAPPAALSAAETMLAEAEEAWTQRWDERALERAIATWRRALGQPGTDRDAVHLRLAKAAFFQGRATLARGGESATALASFEAGVESAAAAGAGASDGPSTKALYWWAANRWAAASQVDYAQSVLVRQQVVAVMRRCRQAGCSYDHGGAARFLGSHNARPLAYPHGDLKRARAHFDDAISTDPQHLPTRVALARDYAVATQDRPLFEQQIRFVLEADPNAAGVDAGNAHLARRQAAALLQEAPNLFE